MDTALIKKENTLGATLLITGCSIGAGMIGFPVMTALAGFFPSTIAMILCYLFTTITGLLILESTLWFDQKVNLLSIAQFALGKSGMMITGFLFLSLFYCLFVAYIDSGGQLFSEILSVIVQQQISREIGIVACVTFVAAIIYAGTKIVDGLNRGLMIGLVVSYGTLITVGLSEVNFNKLLTFDITAAISTIPILLICFGFQNLVPSLTYYLQRNSDAMRFAIIVGNLIALLLYVVWNFVILGMLSETKAGKSESEMVIGLLEGSSHVAMVVTFIKIFSFCAILTSFLANAMTFVDFLKDGLKVTSKFKHECLVYGLVLIPPMIFTLSYPHLFLKALGLAGGLVDVLLFGILPAVIVWIGRYVKGAKGPYTVIGGKVTLSIIILLSLLFLFVRYGI